MSKIDDLEIAKRNDAIESLRLVMPSVLKGERDAAHSKWYAYRFMTPLEATKLFVKLYRVGYKNYLRRENDHGLAERAQGLSTRILGHPSRSLTEVWNARQRADLLGLPYELLIEFGFWFASNYTWKNAPRPAQLFGSKNSGVAWPIEFEKWLLERLPTVVNRFGDLAQYRIEHYRGFPVQNEFRSYLLETLGESVGNWSLKLERQCLATRHLPLRLAMKSVPKGGRKSVVRNLRSEMSSYATNENVAPLQELDLAPACFGIPGAHSADAKQCIECPLFTRCAGATKSVTNFMADKHGSVSPVAMDRLNNRREKTRARVAKLRRNRDLKMAAAAVAL
ncbi:hypothetical protein [Brucella pituitosa]|uniref:Uncharacterized protein n=1 Tax=Brucella pituitosa TaxID=571256 RepID=A0A643EWM6_9HYPH|nr:hypothetical protein [Brucella pituitosa]KAB0568795.1 hypothetical protein F7Q93_18575 [Brucella pituitosa]